MSGRGRAYNYTQAAIDVDRQSKVCTNCGVDKPFTEYAVRKQHPTGRVPHCRTCCTNKTKAYYRKNIELHRIKDMVNYYVRNYKMSHQEAIQRALGNRSGECDICHGTIETVIDHCHTTNAVRGYLCSSCNSLLGYAKDNIDILNAAIEYLKKSRGEL